MSNIQNVRVAEIRDNINALRKRGEMKSQYGQQVRQAVGRVYATVYGEGWENQRLGDYRAVLREFKEKVVAEKIMQKNTAESYCQRVVIAINKYPQHKSLFSRLKGLTPLA